MEVVTGVTIVSFLGAFFLDLEELSFLFVVTGLAVFITDFCELSIDAKSVNASSSSGRICNNFWIYFFKDFIAFV